MASGCVVDTTSTASWAPFPAQPDQAVFKGQPLRLGQHAKRIGYVRRQRRNSLQFLAMRRPADDAEHQQQKAQEDRRQIPPHDESPAPA